MFPKATHTRYLTRLFRIYARGRTPEMHENKRCFDVLYFFIRGYQIPFYSLLGRKNWGTAWSYFVEFDDGEPFLVNLVIFKCVPLREYNLKILAIFMFVMHIHDKLRHFNCRIQDQKAKSGWAGNSLFQFIFVFFPLTLIFFSHILHFVPTHSTPLY